MDTIAVNLGNWRKSLLASIPIGDLQSRNPVAYKWKATYRCWLIREAAFWRVTDLLTQSHELHSQQHGLGARILLRAGFETLASLIYLNHSIRRVLEGCLNFREFGDLTAKMALGSKIEQSWPDPVNVLTMLDRADAIYPGIRKLYDSLSESAHPNFEGMVWGYSKVDHDEYKTNFSNRWMDLYAPRHLESIELCMRTFHHEYNNVWVDLMEKLENWIVENDVSLEATKKGSDN